MKNIFLLLFLVPLSLSSRDRFSCKEEPAGRKHEAGINVFSLMDLRRTYPKSLTSDPYFATGVYYKRHFGQNALRANLDFYNRSVFIENGEPFMGYYKKEGKTRGVELQLGYERAFGKGRFKPYFFTDITLRHTVDKGTYSAYGCFSSCENCPYYEQIEEAGLTGGFGFRYDLPMNFVVAVESGFEGLYRSTTSAGDGTSYTWNEFSGRANPVSSFSLGYSF
jgi:hypothetical protein